MNSSTLRNLTTSAIITAAEYLMVVNGFTTTLEVKIWLRRQGYMAFQASISAEMDRLAEYRSWAYLWNGTYRNYFLAEVLEEDKELFHTSPQRCN